MKKLRKKFILVAMASMFVVLLLMIGGLNVLNYHNLIENGDRLTKMISDNGGSFPRDQKAQNAAPPVLPQGEKPGKDDFHGRAKPNKGDPFAGMVGMLLVHGRFLSSAKGFFPFHGKAQEVRNQAGGEVSRRASDIVKRRGYFCHDNSFEVA